VSDLAAVLPTLTEVRDPLLADEAPRWDLHLERTIELLVPDLVGHLRLHRLLLAEAGVEARRGRQQEASSWLHASWRLRDALADDPLLIQQLISLAELRDELALLRALEDVPPDTAARLRRLHPRPGVERALRMEAWIYVHSLRTGQLESRIKKPPGFGLVFRFLSRLAGAQMVDSADHAIRSIAERDLHGFDAEQFNREQLARVPRWNPMARLLVSTFLDAPAKAARHELDLELTRYLLEARQLIADRGLEGLRSLQRARPAGVHGFVWSYHLQPDLLIISSNGDLPTSSPLRLPLEVRLRLPRPG
jgi:hypothetical protein